MYLFKTSGKTFNSVIKNQKHAFSSMPRAWYPNEIILISKNKNDCNHREKQIQYTMRLDDIRPLKPGESDKYWPGTEGRWKYLVLCENTKLINQPFNLKDIFDEDSKLYRTVQLYRKFDHEHEEIVEDYLRKIGSL
ncbi:MAG: hypothetical protein OEV91_03505 [Desulfobulbaceae bacterium]|nr:hypothetical protein [Desulfobulbaceae bacterium]